MKVRLATAVAFIASMTGFSPAFVPVAAASAGDRTTLISKTGKALEDQLACLSPPKPGVALRAMIANHLVEKTKFRADGSPVFVPRGDLKVFGHRVKFITGWEMEGDTVKEPFFRAPGTEPPQFLSVTLDASPGEVHYTPQQNRKPDGTLEGPFSTIGPANEYYTHTGTIITCYGG